MKFQLAVPWRRLLCYCRLHQIIDPGKPQRQGVHQREVFLFGDLILVTKTTTRAKKQYQVKMMIELKNVLLRRAETPYYPHLFYLVDKSEKEDKKVLVYFNALTADDRARFTNDLAEAIEEVTIYDKILNLRKEAKELMKLEEADKVNNNIKPGAMNSEMSGGSTSSIARNISGKDLTRNNTGSAHSLETFDTNTTNI